MRSFDLDTFAGKMVDPGRSQKIKGVFWDIGGKGWEKMDENCTGGA